MTHHDSTAEPPSRRRFLRGVAALGLGGTVAGSVLTACGDDDDSDAAGGDGGGNGGDIPSARIGYVTPRTGPLAAFGEADAFVLAAMREELGDAVEIIDRDSESDSGRAGEGTRRSPPRRWPASRSGPSSTGPSSIPTVAPSPSATRSAAPVPG
ncbi:MAG TPA: hypothetical protein VFI47_24185 [Acidimicrobiales bacterium]|nr:hypothetical protein [Acidimicrobiales bacterium]